MLLTKLPGVSCPTEDTALLVDALLEAGLPPQATVLDLGVGEGLIADLLAQAGAAQTAVADLAQRGGRARLRGSWCARRLGQFDLVVANVPFLQRGIDTQAMLDRIGRHAARRLRADGTLWLARSSLLDFGPADARLAEAGLRVEIAARREVAFGPTLWSKAASLRAQGRINADQCTEEILVLRASRAELP